MDDTLKGYVINTLNEIKRLALELGDGGGSQDELFEIQDAILGELQK